MDPTARKINLFLIGPGVGGGEGRPEIVVVKVGTF